MQHEIGRLIADYRAPKISSGLSFLNRENAQLSAIKIPEQTTLLIKSKVNLPKLFILLVIHLKFAVKSRTRPRI